MLLINDCYNYKRWAQILILDTQVETQEILKTNFLTSLMCLEDKKK